MSKGIVEIGHFRKCVGYRGNIGVASAVGERPGIPEMPRPRFLQFPSTCVAGIDRIYDLVKLVSLIPTSIF